MKDRTLSVRIDDELDRELERACAETGQSRGDLVRHALRRQLRLVRFERLRGKVLPFAEAAGLLTDEEVYKRFS